MPSVFVIGSSTTLLVHPYLETMLAGVCDYSRKGHESGQLAAAMADLDTPTGASAGDSGMILDYLQTLAAAGGFQPDLVILHVGFHDIRRNTETGAYQVPLPQFRENVAAIVDWFVSRGITLHWILAGPLDETVHNRVSTAFHRYEADADAYNAAAREILTAHRIPILDLPGFTRSLGPLAETLKDHVHFHDPIVRQQAAYLTGHIARHFLHDQS